MLKMVMCITRRSGMSRQEFRDYWLNNHGPLFLKVAKDFRVKKYIQSHTTDSSLNTMMRGVRGMTKEYDGIAEAWWESEDDYIQGLNSPMVKMHGAELLANEKQFIDLENSTIIYTTEHELI